MADLTGQRLGQYLILERISRGASSTVYKAYQEKLERYVAVKVLSPHFIDEEGFLDRFKQEARAVAQLDHPNILPVYDFDQVGDVVYIVMKYVDTGTLKDLMGAPLDLRVALEIFTQIGLALGYAHRQGVIDRDVKPGNILLGAGNWALLTDFGLAKIRAGDRKLTKSGIGMGTPDYMAPEQAQGLPVDGRADLYSLGCMLHEMLTGKVPFEADSGMAVVVKHITESPRPPRELNPNLPLAVEQVILKSIEKDPNKRYQSAESMVTDLTRAIGRVDQVFPPSKPSRLASARSRTAEPASPTGITSVIPVPVHPAGSRAALASRARRAGQWIAAQSRRAALTIWAALGRAWRWLRQAVMRASGQAQRGYERMRERITAWNDSRRARLRRAAKMREAKASPLTPAQAFVAFARERLTRRRVAAASVIALLLVLLLVAVSNPGSSDAR
ncbi:MAG TPA: serine/threonine-protein kinase, partial [Anaerolineae bacterium]|nr:serine/threonine-protein kinase [Anaerolineae bacterium]